MKRRAYRATTRIAAAVTTLLILAGCNQGAIDDAGEDPTSVVFAEVPSKELSNTQSSFQPILDMLAAEIDEDISIVNANDYDAVIQGLRNGTIDLAVIGPFSYALAKQQGAQITVVGAQVDEKGEDPGYRSYGITRANSPIETLADFRGKKVCFVDRNSTSGYLYPSAELLALGINPEQDITPVFAGGHDTSVVAVANGQCDVGFAFDSMVERQLIEQRLIKSGDITTAWKSDIIPGAPIVIADGLPEQLRRQLTTVLRQKANADYLRANGFCQGECAIADENSWGFVAADDTLYDSVREVCRAVQHKLCTGG